MLEGEKLSVSSREYTYLLIEPLSSSRKAPKIAAMLAKHLKPQKSMQKGSEERSGGTRYSASHVLVGPATGKAETNLSSTVRWWGGVNVETGKEGAVTTCLLIGDTGGFKAKWVIMARGLGCV